MQASWSVRCELIAVLVLCVPCVSMMLGAASSGLSQGMGSRQAGARGRGRVRGQAGQGARGRGRARGQAGLGQGPEGRDRGKSRD